MSRCLLITTGCPGSGKSYWVESQGLKQYELCADDIRLLVQSPVLTLDGGLAISQKNDKTVWDFLMNALESRMARGEFTIVNSCNSKSSDWARYKKLAEQYRYRIYAISFRDVPIEVAKEQNRKRDSYKFVPESVIDLQYARFQNQKIPSYVTVIKPENFNDLLIKPLDFNKWSRIHIFGDVHGCMYPIETYFTLYPYSPDDFYIFVGDYLDRGIQNDKVVKWLETFYNRHNVLLLEGNHEKWARYWANNQLEDIKAREFIYNTQPQLEAAKIDKKTVRNICRKMAQFAYFTYKGKTWLITHAGIPNIPQNLLYIASEEFIKGVGKYEDMREVCKVWMNKMPEDHYCAFGHRNLDNTPIQVEKRCFNLDGHPDMGGDLRYLQIADSIIGGAIPNIIYNSEIKIKSRFKKKDITKFTSNSELIEELRKEKSVYECKMDRFSSFNFKKDVFFKRSWTSLNKVARAFFTNNQTNEIVARAWTKFDYLRKEDEIKYPVTAYVKENGFLFLLGYDSQSDEFVFCSKSRIDGTFSDYAEKIFRDRHQSKANEIKNYLKENNVCFVFECIDPINDPHIIEYYEPKIVLLEIYYRTLEDKHYNYQDLVGCANKFGLEYKRAHQVIEDKLELDNFIDLWENEREYKNIEGFVLEDVNGFKFKVKTGYYGLWKHMRTVKDQVRLGRQVRLGGLLTPLENEFYGWCIKQDREHLKKSIIELREEFYNK